MRTREQPRSSSIGIVGLIAICVEGGNAMSAMRIVGPTGKHVERVICTGLICLFAITLLAACSNDPSPTKTVGPVPTDNPAAPAPFSTAGPDPTAAPAPAPTGTAGPDPTAALLLPRQPARLGPTQLLLLLPLQPARLGPTQLLLLLPLRPELPRPSLRPIRRLLIPLSL